MLKIAGVILGFGFFSLYIYFMFKDWQLKYNIRNSKKVYEDKKD